MDGTGFTGTGTELVNTMNFDAKLFGSRLKEAVLRKHTLTEATRKLQEAGLDKVTPPRLSEYFAGVKVPTLERFSQMVFILGLDVSVVFPGWGQKVQAIRHPRERKNSQVQD